MLSRTGSGRALRRLVRVGLEPGNQFFQVACRQVLPRHDDIGIAGQTRDRFEIFQHVVRQRVDRSVHDVRRPVADADGVPVGGGAHRAADTDGARRAGHILDDDRLAKRRPHGICQGACQGIDRAARAEWYDQGNRMRWVWLGHRGAYECQGSKGHAER